MKHLGTTLLTLAFFCLCMPDASAQNFERLAPRLVDRAVRVNTSIPLRDMPVVAGPFHDGPYVVPNKFKFEHKTPSPDQPGFTDPALQSTTGPLAAATTGIGFDGASDDDNKALLDFRVVPPDTEGDVGPNHYVQWINLVAQIFDKNGTTLVGPFPGNQFFRSLGGRCEGTNDGDPIVLYDHLAGRWLVSQFVASSPYAICIAISTTPDPTGSYHQYQFDFDTFPDYYKVGVRDDGYYITTRSFSSRGPFFFYNGQEAVVVERQQMLSGGPAQIVVFDIPGGTGNDGFLPADLDGPNGPTNGLFAGVADVDGGNNQTARLYQLNVDWSNPNQSSFSELASITVDPFDPSISSIPQPSPGGGLDALANFTMHRAQYRSFTGYEVLMLNHTVDVGGNRAGVRWYELRNSGSGWGVYQQGTYAPSDGLHRWMGSIAMNANGDIGLCYSVSSTTTFPSIRCTGQTVAQTGTGTMDVVEFELKAGGGSQTDASRWGDYSMLSIDPVDDSFWYTQEYYAATGSFDFNTWIANFSIGEGETTNTAPVVTINKPADGATFASGASVTFEGTATDIEDGDISASLSWESSRDGSLGTGASVTASLSDGTHTITASVTDSGAPTGNPLSGSDQITVTVGTPPEPTTMTVVSLTAGTQNAGGGQVHGTATGEVIDDLGSPVQGATVTVSFSAPFNETGSDLTDASGSFFVVTNNTVRRRDARTFQVCVEDVTKDGLTWDGSFACSPTAPVTASAGKTSIETATLAGSEAPAAFALDQNYPNPFNPSTIVTYSLPEGQYVTLTVVNVLGQVVATLVDGYHEAGQHRATFDGSALSGGVYLAVLRAGGQTTTRRMTLLK